MVESLKIENLNTGSVKQFDMAEADYLIYEGSIDWGNAQVDHSTFQFPQQIGSYITNTIVGSRDIAINGWIIGDNLDEIVAKKKALSAFINPLNDFKIVVGQYYIDAKPTSNVVFGKEYTENNDVAVKFLIQMTCPYPLFVLTNPFTVNVASNVGGFHFPLTIPKNGGIIMGYRKQSLFTNVSNFGAIDIGMVVTLTARAVVNNPAIINVNTHEQLKINKVMDVGEKIVIDTSIGNRSIVGIKGEVQTNYLKYLDYDSVWLQLATGTSLLTYKTYNANGNEDETYKNLDVVIQYRTALYNLEEE